MKVNDFISDWNRIHTSSPSFQDVLDWADQKQSEEIKKQISHDAIEKAKTAFGKACGWLSTYPWYNAVVEEFIKNMEE